MTKRLGIVLIFAGLVSTILLRATNLDLTEGQLFVEYWPWWVSILCGTTFGYLLFSLGERE